MNIYNATDLELTNTPALEPQNWSRVGDAGPSPPPAPLHRLLSRPRQAATEQLARLKTAVALIRTSIDPAWVAVALLILVMCGGFTWLSTKLNRVEAQLDAASLKIAELPGGIQRDLQAQTETVTALINAHRQSGSAASSGGGVGPTHAALPAPNSARTGMSVAQTVKFPLPPMPPRGSRPAITTGAGNSGNNGNGATNPGTTSARSRP